MNKHSLTVLIISHLLLSFSCTCTKTNDTPQKKIFSFDQTYKIASEYMASDATLKITIKLDPEIHAYAPGEAIGRPVDLKIKTTGGWKAASEPIIPSGTKKKLDGLGESFVLTDKVEIIQKLTPSTGRGEATLYLQVCTETTCDRPREHPIVWNATK